MHLGDNSYVHIDAFCFNRNELILIYESERSVYMKVIGLMIGIDFFQALPALKTRLLLMRVRNKDWWAVFLIHFTDDE